MMKSPILSPFYHTVSDEKLPHLWPLYDVMNVERFSSQMDFLAARYEFVNPEGLLGINLKGEWRGNKPPVFLSFDDGLKECYTVIAPILKEKGIPATFFINPSFIDTEDIFFRYKIGLIINELQKGQINMEKEEVLKDVLRSSDHLKYTLEDSLLSMTYSDTENINYMIRSINLKYRNTDIYMSGDQIKDLKNDGFSIGAHSLDHPMFSDLKLEDQLWQIRESVEYCRKKFNEEFRLFAFPFFDFNVGLGLYPKMYNDLHVDLSFGTSGYKKDEFARSIQRLDMEKATVGIKSYIHRSQLHYKLKKIVGKHILRRQE